MACLKLFLPILLCVAPAWSAEPKAIPPPDWPVQVERGETVVLRAPADAISVAWAVLPVDTNLWLFEDETVLVLETLRAPEVLIVSMATANGDIDVVLHEIQVGGEVPGPDPPPPPPPPPPPENRMVVVLHETGTSGETGVKKAAVLTAIRKYAIRHEDRLIYRFLDDDQVDARTGKLLPEIEVWLAAVNKAGVSIPALLVVAGGSVVAVEPLPATAEEAIEIIKANGG